MCMSVDVLKTHQYEIVINKNPAIAVLKKANKISNNTKAKANRT